MTNLYINKFPARAIFVVEIIIGSILLYFFLNLIRNEIYLDIWTFAGPLLALAMIITGLTGSKINEINYNLTNNYIEIRKESFYKVIIKRLDASKMNLELKTVDGKKNSVILKLRLVILDSDKQIEVLESGFLALNNSKIKKLYIELKEIKKNNERQLLIQSIS